MINPQIAKLVISTKYCTTLSQNSHNSRLFTRFFLLCTHFIWSFICYIWKGKVIYLRTCGSFKSANHKKLGPQKANPQRVTFAEGPQILKSTNLRICDMRNLFTDPPTLIKEMLIFVRGSGMTLYPIP